MNPTVVTLKGKLLAGPPKVSCDKFPSALVNAEFELSPPNKQATRSAYHLRQVTSSSTFFELDGVGPTESVTQGSFLYMRTNGTMLFRLTTNDPNGSPVVSVIPVSGLMVIEFPSPNYLSLLEAQGSGTVEYFVSGPQ